MQYNAISVFMVAIITRVGYPHCNPEKLKKAFRFQH